ncbi:MAG: PQQ-dependent sugar dehydrogenase [Candidatus Saccharimonadales bacterium]
MQRFFGNLRFSTRYIVLAVLMAGVVFAMVLVYVQGRVEKVSQKEQGAKPAITPAAKTPIEPQLAPSEVLSGLSHPWDVVFLPDRTLLFNERGGQVSKLVDGKKVVIADIADVYAVGEGGLTGLALDAKFAANRYLYTCFNAQTASGLDVRLVRWKLSEDATSLTDRKDIVVGIPSNRSGRHSGCRVRSDAQGDLWVGTGDAAVASNPQSPSNLGGKILHVTRDGMPAGGNLPAPFDPRIFSYGHRNVQGLVLFNEPQDGVYGYSVEHGTDRDDEINLLKSGNFGWAPRVTYVESGIPMTDLTRFPDAISAIWSSGNPTIAPSGATLLKGEKWGTWTGAVAMAVLKGKHLRIMRFDESYKLIEEKVVLGDYGRIRSAAIDTDQDLYITTDNGSNDKIIKVTPTGN